MRRTLLNNISPGIKLILDLLVLFVGFLVFFGTGLIIGAKIFHVSISQMLVRGAVYNDLALLRYLVFLQTVSLFLLPSLLIGLLYGSPADTLLMRRWPNFRVIIMIVVAFIVIQGVVSYLAEINRSMHLPNWLSGLEEYLKRMEEQTEQLTIRLLSGTSVKDLLLNLFIVALVPAVSEEFFFRGVLQQRFIQIFRNSNLGIWLAAFVFAFVHFEFFTFLPRFLLGLVLGYLFYWTRSIWASALAHFTNNALGVVMYFVAAKKGIPLEQMDKNLHVPFLVALISLAIVVGLMYKVKQEAES